MTPPVAQATPVALGTPVLAQAAPVAGVQTAFGQEVRSGCGPLRCIHITVMIFGIINLFVGLMSMVSDSWFGLIMGLAMGALGITAGSMMNAMTPCGCCSDPVPGTCQCCNPAGTKCIAGVNIANCVLHIVNIILIIIIVVAVGEGCDLTSDNRCGGRGLGEQLTIGCPFKSDDPRHKQIITEKDLSSNKGIDPHTAGSELVQLGALVHLHGAASTRYAASTPRSISSITTPASLGDGSEVRVIYGHGPCTNPPPTCLGAIPNPLLLSWNREALVSSKVESTR